MGILDDVVINVKSAAEVVGKKAGQIVDISKLRINISELNGEINKRVMELGQHVYESKKIDEVDEEVINLKISEIDELHAQLETVVQEIGVKQNKTSCPVCNKQCNTGAFFCSFCGAKLQAE